MGMVFQSYAIWPHFTVFENIAFPLRLRKMTSAELRQRVEEALEIVGLAGLGERPATALSGGQQQRVFLARARPLEPGLDLDRLLEATRLVDLQAGRGEEAAPLTLRPILDVRGIAQAIRPPTVPEGSSRLRLTVMASHTKSELREAARVLRGCVRVAPHAVPDVQVFDGLRDAA